MFVTVVLSCTEVVEPSVVYRTPPAAPPTQMFVPSVLVALRGLLPVAQSVSAVVVSMLPFASTRPTTRLTVVDAVPATPAVPRAASYPLSTRKLLSAERVSSPSEVADPEAVSRWFDPFTAVGMGRLWTGAPPDCVYSSRKTGFATLLR